MVRHEAAEALGGIASDGVDEDIEQNQESQEEEIGRDGDDEKLPPGGVLAILKEWAVKEDAPIVVRESCQVAIDMWEYENSTEQFNPLDKLGSSTSDKGEKAYTTGMERSAHAAVSAGTAVKA